MSSGQLYGWDSAGNAWTRLLCNADGELLIDPLAIFEDVPSDGEMAKAPTSNWAYVHENDTEAHHDIYTDGDARGAINNVLNSNGRLIMDLFCQYYNLRDIAFFQLKKSATDGRPIYFDTFDGDPSLYVYAYQGGVGAVDTQLKIHYNNDYRVAIHTEIFQAAMALYLEEAPTDGEVEKAPTSNWAHDHEADESIHFAKYTDLEAQQAVNLDGDLYLSIPGYALSPVFPHIDPHTNTNAGSYIAMSDDRRVTCAVMLPHGATVTACYVKGNAGSSDSTWILKRAIMSTQSLSTLATANVGTEDTAIDNAVIDNASYVYLITIADLKDTDQVDFIRIRYTL